MYEYPLNFLGFDLNATKVGDYVTLSFDSITWGIEALMSRWLRYSFVDTEWWYDDFHMNATIRDANADLKIETVVANAVFAYESVDDGEPCWVWQGMLGDYLPSDPSHPLLPTDHKSDFDPYVDDGYILLSPGSSYYDMFMSYDYTPGAQNLSVNERLKFEWPSGVQLFKVHEAPGMAADEYAYMNVFYSEPYVFEIPGQIVLNELKRTITYYGPIDFWTWSRDQSLHDLLEAEWDRLGILPYGMPWIEFAMAPSLVAEAGDNQTILVGETVALDGSGSQSYFWPSNFTWTFSYDGDEVKLYGVKVSFMFSIPGLYEITLNVSDGLGRYDTDVVWIEVNPYIPEFGSVAIPLILASGLVLVFMARARRRR
jgi:hypothetical protein